MASLTTDLTRSLHILWSWSSAWNPQPTSTSTTHAGCTGDAPPQSRPHTWSLWGRSRERQAPRKITEQDSFEAVTHLILRGKTRRDVGGQTESARPLAANVGIREEGCSICPKARNNPEGRADGATHPGHLLPARRHASCIIQVKYSVPGFSEVS